MSKTFLCIDGGGTKTLGVLYDQSGNEIKRTVQGFSNFSVDFFQSIKNIELTIETLLKESNYQDLIIQMGIAGYSALEDKISVENSLSEKFNAKVFITSDARIALYAAASHQNDNVVLAISGTGSVVMVKDRDTDYQRGGFGHILGDEGSAYHLVIEALKMLIDEIENKKMLSNVSKKIMETLDIHDVRQIIPVVYKNDKTKVAALSRIIAKEAQQGDEKAVRLFENEGHLIGQQIINAVNQLSNQHSLTIAFHGGFIEKAPYVKNTVKHMLEQFMNHYILKETINEAVKGAYYLANANLARGEDIW